MFICFLINVNRFAKHVTPNYGKIKTVIDRCSALEENISIEGEALNPINLYSYCL